MRSERSKSHITTHAYNARIADCQYAILAPEKPNNEITVNTSEIADLAVVTFQYSTLFPQPKN